MLTRKIYNSINYIHKGLLDYPKTVVAKKRLQEFKKPYKLHVGCGSIKFDHWINLDIENKYGKTDVVWNVAQGFPFIDSESCSLIYSEHFLEHLKIDEAKIFLSECYRTLKKNGVVRIAIPSLEYVINKYQSEDWKNQDWLTWKGHEFIQTRAEMINVSFRWWGHQWLYDREELNRRLSDAGFRVIREMQFGVSNITELQQRETRKDSLLIVEAEK